MATKRFTIAKWFVIANYFTTVVSFIFGLFFIVGPIFLWHTSSLLETIVFFFAGICFIAGGIYAISIVPRMQEVVHVSENQIMHEHSDGTFTTIWWKENFEIRDRQLLGRLELISQDGQRIIKIEHQIDGYQEICELITATLMEKQVDSL